MDDDEALKKLLESSRTIAVVGAKDAQGEDAYRVPAYLAAAGYEVIPINPKLERVLDRPCLGNLGEIGPDPGQVGDRGASERSARGVDIVNLFRASEHVPGHVDEILAMEPRPGAVWMQLGIHDGPSARRLREAGIEVIQDRCIMVDHRRLVGATH